MTIIPFDPPELWTARLMGGFVDIPDRAIDDGSYCRGWDTTVMTDVGTTTTTGDGNDDDDDASKTKTTTTTTTLSSSSIKPPSLQRKQTMSGNIIVVTPPPEDDDHGHPSQPPPIAYWLQRKIGQHRHGIVRLGYKLRPRNPMTSSPQDDPEAGGPSMSNLWELETDDVGRQTLVGVTIINNTNIIHGQHLQQQKKTTSPSSNVNNQDGGDDKPFPEKDDELSSSSSASVFLQTDRSPLDEISALQMIARYHNSTSTTMAAATTSAAAATTTTMASSSHVVGTNMVAATCSRSIYTIVKYYRDGTLLQFCQTVGCLDEPLGRYLFRQILQGLNTLQKTGLCHRNLSLDAIGMDGDHLDICDMGWAIRFKEDNNDEQYRNHPLPPPGGSDPRYIAPEYIATSGGGGGGINDVDDANNNHVEMKWNGFQADLWAAGLMLYGMIVGTESLFIAPIYEDKTFAKLCVKGDIRGHVKKYARVVGRADDSTRLSEDLVDLLRSMLRANPSKRLSLEEVMEHPWVTNDEVITPSEWMAKNRPPY